eukprot:366347-Chlamydomonas_euryale.AAC.11
MAAVEQAATQQSPPCGLLTEIAAARAWAAAAAAAAAAGAAAAAAAAGAAGAAGAAAAAGAAGAAAAAAAAPLGEARQGAAAAADVTTRVLRWFRLRWLGICRSRLRLLGICRLTLCWLGFGRLGCCLGVALDVTPASRWQRADTHSMSAPHARLLLAGAKKQPVLKFALKFALKPALKRALKRVLRPAAAAGGLTVTDLPRSLSRADGACGNASMWWPACGGRRAVAGMRWRAAALPAGARWRAAGSAAWSHVLLQLHVRVAAVWHPATLGRELSAATSVAAAPLPRAVAATSSCAVAATLPRAVAATLSPAVAATLPRAVAATLPRAVRVTLPCAVAATLPRAVAATLPRAAASASAAAAATGLRAGAGGTATLRQAWPPIAERTRPARILCAMSRSGVLYARLCCVPRGAACPMPAFTASDAAPIRPPYCSSARTRG